MDKQQVLTKMTDAGLVAVVRASNAEDAIRITDACLEGGCPSIELTFTVPGAAKVMRLLLQNTQTARCFWAQEPFWIPRQQDRLFFQELIS